MSEVANCPLCGKKPFPYHYEKDHIEYVHCGVKCEDEGTWNRYAAAMEFVEWVSRQHYANGLSKAMIIQKAKEVFK